MTIKTYVRIADGIVAEIVTLDASLNIANCFHANLVFVDVTSVAPTPQIGNIYTAPLTFGPTPVAVLTPQQRAAALISAGIAIASTGTPALNGTYAIDLASKTNIDGIYTGIKNGDGVPGSGETFNYADKNGTFHQFNATSFPNFAKAVRDYLYAISQGATPDTPVQIA